MTRGKHVRRLRWETVCRMHASGQSWIVPVSEGRDPHRTWLGAWWTARRWTRQHATRPGPCMTWEVRQRR